MKVPITQHHIDHGIKHDCNRCVLALAIKDVVREDVSVHVGVCITLETSEQTWTIATPKEAIALMVDFDMGLKIVPTEIPLDIFEWALRSAA